MRIVNTELLAEPVNWVTVPIFVLIIASALYLLNPWNAPK